MPPQVMERRCTWLATFNDLIPGRVDAMINFTSSSLPLVRQGQLRALAVTTANRLSVAPELPTMVEAGVAGMEVSAWSGLFVPARTHQEIIRKIQTDTVAALAEPAVRENWNRAASLSSALHLMSLPRF